MIYNGPAEERVIYRQRFHAEHFDFRSILVFTRFDECEFVDCTLLIDDGTQQLAFTACTFRDCNIDTLEPDMRRGLFVRSNIFVRPLKERRQEFESRLARALASRPPKKLMG